MRNRTVITTVETFVAIVPQDCHLVLVAFDHLAFGCPTFKRWWRLGLVQGCGAILRTGTRSSPMRSGPMRSGHVVALGSIAPAKGWVGCRKSCRAVFSMVRPPLRHLHSIRGPRPLPVFPLMERRGLGMTCRSSLRLPRNRLPGARGGKAGSQKRRSNNP